MRSLFGKPPRGTIFAVRREPRTPNQVRLVFKVGDEAVLMSTYTKEPSRQYCIVLPVDCHLFNACTETPWRLQRHKVNCLERQERARFEPPDFEQIPRRSRGTVEGQYVRDSESLSHSVDWHWTGSLFAASGRESGFSFEFIVTFLWGRARVKSSVELKERNQSTPATSPWPGRQTTTGLLRVGRTKHAHSRIRAHPAD